jgi:transketolase C-terminal domain/subunit
LENKLHRIGIPDNFVEHGRRDELLDELGLCAENIISILTNDKLEEVYE